MQQALVMARYDAQTTTVIRGLDPRISTLNPKPDARIKSGHDEAGKKT
jgi:hypothetical protein